MKHDAILGNKKKQNLQDKMGEVTEYRMHYNQTIYNSSFQINYQLKKYSALKKQTAWNFKKILKAMYKPQLSLFGYNKVLQSSKTIFN